MQNLLKHDRLEPEVSEKQLRLLKNACKLLFNLQETEEAKRQLRKKIESTRRIRMPEAGSDIRPDYPDCKQQIKAAKTDFTLHHDRGIRCVWQCKHFFRGGDCIVYCVTQQKKTS